MYTLRNIVGGAVQYLRFLQPGVSIMLIQPPLCHHVRVLHRASITRVSRLDACGGMTTCGEHLGYVEIRYGIGHPG